MMRLQLKIAVVPRDRKRGLEERNCQLLKIISKPFEGISQQRIQGFDFFAFAFHTRKILSLYRRKQSLWSDMGRTDGAGFTTSIIRGLCDGDEQRVATSLRGIH